MTTKEPVTKLNVTQERIPKERLTKARVTTKDAATKVAHQRLSVLQLAQTLGNISHACRRSGMDRTSFYEWKKRFETLGMDGLKDLPPIVKEHPQATPPDVVAQLLDMALEHPSWGCTRLADHLKLSGASISSPTVQSILIKHDLGSRFARYLRLEQKAAHEAFTLTPEQIAQIEKFNPAFRERHVESQHPGQLLAQDTFEVGTIKGIGRVYLQAVVDTFGSYAFGFLHTSKRPECAVAVLYNDVLPFYQEQGITVSTVLTDNGREFCGTPSHPFELYLALCGIEHRTTRVRRPQSNGFVERFHRTVKDEFLAEAFRTRFYESVEALQADFDAWLVYYNTERPH